MLRTLAAALLALVAMGATSNRSGATTPVADEAPCIAVHQVIPFAPRGEVYVEVQARCGPEHFAREDPIVAYLEVLVRDASPVGEDVRVYADAPHERSTLEFRDLAFESGDSILVRLSRFGEILAIQSVQVP